MSWRALLERLTTTVIPHRCLLCRDTLGDIPGLCVTCWEKMTFLHEPLCDRCGIPLPESEDSLCGSCLTTPPYFTRTRAVFVYDDHSRHLVLNYKNHDKTYLAKHVAPWLTRAGYDLIADANLIVPVPLHWTRLWRRQFNQATLLARHLSHITNLPYHHVLTRRTRTPLQHTLSRKGRLRNVAHVFAIKKPHLINGKTCLLIDDVMTTGATTNACAKVLLHHGAKEVYVLTLARTVLVTP